MEKIPNKSHVLVLPYPAQGHINPMVQFSKRLTSRGVKVTLVTTNSVSKNMPKESGSFKIESINPHDDDDDSPPPEKLDESIVWFFNLVSKNLGAIVEKLSDSEYPVKALVFDSVFTWAIDLAHQLGLKGAAFFTQSYGSDVSLPSLPLLEKEDLPSFIYESDLYPTLSGFIFGQNINFKKADWLFFNTFDALEKEAYTNDLKLVVAEFVQLGIEHMIATSCGLLELQNRTNSPRNSCPRQRERTNVNWSPQLDVLSHRAVGCFFTHCGWNSTLEAHSLGVPMVAMPQWSDQPTNAKFIRDVWQTGLRVKAGENGVVNRDEIAKCIWCYGG
ncbi:hypothetical protein HAX54_016793 [Datura stramonium]|uniref:Glycosyltransferase N-terminal domain-containing protein n=1 Tax=Datura stramonium TaxID=4076 RepID=A0ABS8UJR3_DATST|nr:hypothetical protein [Datura stramonium]